MNHSTVSGCGEIEHSENSRKSGQQKNPTARKQLEISIKRTLKIGHCLCRFCAIQQRKKAVAISLPQLFGGSWWIRKPRSKKQSAGLFFAVCGRPTCSNPTSSSTKKNPQPKLRQFVKEYSPKSLRNREGFWYNRRKPPREAPSWKSTPKTPAAKQWLLT